MINDRIGAVLLCFVFLATGCSADDPLSPEPTLQILSEVPDAIHLEARYLFYLHGAIIERAGERPTHPEFGVYEYRQILEVFASRGLVVISEARPAGTEVMEYAAGVAGEVRTLLDSGVLPGNITIAGFSKGGGIAAAASSILAEEEVNFVFMGTCGAWLDDRPEIVPHGRMLSLHEASDDMVGSCEGLFSRAGDECVHREIVIEIGGGHGAFYRPDPAWLDPVFEWAASLQIGHPGD
jgi:hypothetical protein